MSNTMRSRTIVQEDMSNYCVTLLLIFKFQMNPYIEIYEKYIS